MKPSAFFCHSLSIALAAVVAVPAQAALHDRGSGMIYDDILNITWLQDANYAKSSGYSTYGHMNLAEATAWVDQLVYGGFEDWRLPSITLLQDPAPGCFAYDGSCNAGFNTTNSELAHLYYVTLGNSGAYDTSGVRNSWNPLNDNYSFVDATTGQTKSFINVGAIGLNANNSLISHPSRFWLEPIGNTPGELVFNAVAGGETFYAFFGDDYSAWAVRDGDVALSTPIPAAAWLFGSALIGLAGMKRRK